MVETQYLFQDKADQAELRFSQMNNRLLDDDDQFHSALTPDDRMMQAEREKLLPAAA